MVINGYYNNLHKTLIIIMFKILDKLFINKGEEFFISLQGGTRLTSVLLHYN